MSRATALLLLLFGSGSFVGCTTAPAARATGAEQEMKLWLTEGGDANRAPAALRIAPGSADEATAYYRDIRANLAKFPQANLADSVIADMLAYYGFPAIPAETLEALDPAVIMDFPRLREAIGTPAFEAAYQTKPLQAKEILVTRFFAPKIVNVRDPQVDGVPVAGFGWRKVLRFRAREGSDARADGLDAFFLLFNFTSGNSLSFPATIHAAQIQAMLVPTYPTATTNHRDAYFLVYESLGSTTATPGKVGLYLIATFDLAGAVSTDDKYYVPRACGQCHGTDVPTQKGAKVNYLDTDHWIDRTGEADDFHKIPEANVLPDGDASYATFRDINRAIEQQNAALIAQSPGPAFALLAVRKWLELHQENAPDANRHVPAIRRGFAANPGGAVWTPGAAPDEELLPLLNRYCFRCHSSVRYHVFQKEAVRAAKSKILARLNNGTMPQDRTLSQADRDKIKALVSALP